VKYYKEKIVTSTSPIQSGNARLKDMVNSHARKALRRGQLKRDGRRCDALEALGRDESTPLPVFTLDTNRSSDDAVVKPERHSQGNIYRLSQNQRAIPN
jgi:hypothetical protein